MGELGAWIRDRPELWWLRLPWRVYVAVACTLLALFIQLRRAASSYDDGRLAPCGSVDLGTVGFGLVGIVIGALLITLDREMTRRQRVIMTLVGLGAAAVGVVNLLRAVGVLDDGC